MEHHPYQGAGESSPRRPIPSWLDDESIEEFRKIYEEEFGEQLTEGEARLIATRLLELYDLLCRSKRRSSDSEKTSLT